MHWTIERTIIWDEVGNCWRDKQTGVNVKGMGRQLFDGGVAWKPSENLRTFAEQQNIPVDRWEPVAPSQPNDEQAQRISGLIDAVREDWLPALERKLTERLQGIARDEATHVLAAATVDPHPHYFAPEDHKLTTYLYHRTLVQTIQVFGARLNEVEQRQRPWWKRWFNR